MSDEGSGGRAIPWDALDASALPEGPRRTVGATWLERMKQEHLAVGAFSMVTVELAETGCDPVVLELTARAASDEVRHADVCRRMATALLGPEHVPSRLRGVPKIPPYTGKDMRERCLLHMMEMCCLSETITGVFFTEMLARAKNPVAHAAVEALLRDEIDHGKVGWAYLASRKGDPALTRLGDELPNLFERTAGRALRSADKSEEGDAAMEEYGWLGRSAALSTIQRAVREVIVPGFEVTGVDLGASRATLEGLLRAP